MKIPASIQRWGLIKIFAFFSFVSIVTISVVSGYIFFSYLRNNLLQHEINISTEFIQSISLINNHEAYFNQDSSAYDIHEINEFLSHIISMPDVFRVVAYNANLKILWANNPELIGRTYSDNDELNKALAGASLYEEAERNHHHKQEHETIPQDVEKFIESYIPVWDQSQQRVVGVLEIYKSPRALYQAINEAQYLVIIVSLFGAIILYWVLYWIVQTAHQLIESQRERIKQATNRTVELNEQNLRRIGSELHDGPAQSIGFALLKLDSIQESGQASPSSSNNEIYDRIEMALRDALQEIRDLSAGLMIPELEDLTVQEAVIRLIEKHENRTTTKVNYNLHTLPVEMKTSLKICVYRLVQEGLNNAFKHGKGIDQTVTISSDKKTVNISISDAGPGLEDDDITTINADEHLGLRGLRERVESLGGTFRISSNFQKPGVELYASLPFYD